MGRKVHPTGFRIGVIRDWQAKWYADKHYPEFIQEDVKIRKAIREKYAEAGVSLVEIERQANKVSININTARPGIVIGRGGQRVDETRHYLEDLIGKKIQLNIQEIRQPELDAYLVARSVAEQMERRIAYRRAMKQSIFRTMQAGALGMRIICSGRLGGVEIARRQMMHQGRVPLHTLRADIDYGFTEANTTLGRIGVKVWIYRGDILPEVEEKPLEETPVEIAKEQPVKTEPVEAKKEKKAEKAEVAAEAEAVPIEEEKEKPKAKKVVKKKDVKEEVAEEVKEEVKAEKETKPKAKKAAPKKAAAEEAEKEVEKKVTAKTKAAAVKEGKKTEAKAEKKVTKAKADKAETADKKTKAKETAKKTKTKKAEEIEAGKTDATTEEG